MGFLKRLWGYLKTLFRIKTEAAMNPEVEIEQAISEARKRDQELRNQAAKVVAHRTQLESKIDRAADGAGEARELAKQALLKAQEATATGDGAAADKWTQTAQSVAMKLQASENNLNSLKGQYESASVQADDAKKAVQQDTSLQRPFTLPLSLSLSVCLPVCFVCLSVSVFFFSLSLSLSLSLVATARRARGKGEGED